MYNKKVLSIAVSELDKAKKPTKKRDNVIKAKRHQQPIVSTEGFKQGPPPPGTKYRIPGDTLYNPTPYPIEAVSDNGIRKTLNPFDTTNTYFPGANYVDEYEKKEEGGEYYDDELTQEEIDDLIAQGYIVEDLPKAQLGKGTTVEVSPFSLNANQSQLASNVYGEYDPEFLIGARTPLGGSRDPRFSTDLGLTLGIPYSGSMIPSVNADWRWRYRPSAVSAGAFAPTVQTDITLGWDPTQGFNHQMVASPRWEFANRMLGVYRQPRWPVGAWKGYAGPAAGWEFRQHSFVPGLEGYQNTGEHRTGNFNFDYGAVAGIEGRPFKSTPLRVGADASLMFQPGKGQAEEQFNPDTDFNSVKWGMTPMLKVKAVYPIGANLSKKKEAEEEKIKLDATRANDKNFMVTAPTITGPGVDWGYEEKPESTGVPVGYLPGYEPETGRKLTEQELMQRYGQGPRLAKGGSLLTKKVTCKKCGWKWDAADGGNDVDTCHKCGGKGLVQAQFGMFNKWKKKNVDQVIEDAEPVKGVQDIPEMTAYGSDAKKKLQRTLMDKANALWDTVQGRRVWMENGPKNYSIEELQKFVNGVKEFNDQAQRYERDRRLVQEGKLSTDVFAQRFKEGNWARFDENTGRENYRGEYKNAVDEGMKRKQDNYELVKEFGKEMSGYNSAKRIANDPLGTVEGVVQTGADALMLPFAVNKGLYNYFAEDDFDMGINPLTGLPYGEGFNETMDVASVLPLFRGARTLLNPTVKNVTNNVVKGVTNTYNKVATGNSALPIAWKVEKPTTPIRSSDYITRAYTDAEIKLLDKYGKGMWGLTPEDWVEMEKLTKSGVTDFSKGDYPISRILGYYKRGSQENEIIKNLKRGEVFSTPTEENIRTWSVGVPKGGFPGGSDTRLIIPSRHTKNLGNNFSAMPYYDKRLDFIYNPNGTLGNYNAVLEKELMGNIPGGFKVIGKTVEDGKTTLIIKPHTPKKGPLGFLGLKEGGMTMGQEIDLTPEQEAYLRRQGYKLERV
jgi:hypothetical protein